MHQEKERWYRNSIFSFSHGQGTQPNQERFFYLAPPSYSLPFALLLLMLWAIFDAGSQEAKRNTREKKGLGQTKSTCLGNLGNRSLLGKLHEREGVTILYNLIVSPLAFFIGV